MKKKAGRAVKVKLFVTPHRKGERSPHASSNETTPSNHSPLLKGGKGGSNPSQPSPNSLSAHQISSPKVKVLVSADRRRRPAQPTAILDEPDWDEEDWDEEPTVKFLVAPKQPLIHRGCLSALLLSGFWLAIASLLTGSGWVAIQLIINPGSVGWLSWMLPEWNRTPLVSDSAPRSLSDIRDSLAKDGLTLGSQITLESDHLLFPVLDTQGSCADIEAIATSSPTCHQIVELRVYKVYRDSTRNPILSLADHLAVRGPEEFFVVAPLVSSVRDSQGSSRSLPFTDLHVIPGQAPAGTGNWLQLEGHWQRGSNRLVYGQVVYYDAKQSRLNLLSQWTSPAGEVAAWRAVTSDQQPDLVINQAVGLEPSFQVYQVKFLSASLSPVQLTEISLTALDLNNSTYKNGMTLARSGLWSPALRLLNTAKARSQGRSNGWSEMAQAQLDVVALHAQVTAKQAEHSWASPGQKITAQLIDGRWTDALTSLQAASREGFDVTRLLRDQSGSLWRRINAALQVNSAQTDVQAWGMLVVAMQQSRSAAIAWLQAQLERSGRLPSQNTILDPHLQQSLGLLNNLTAARSSDHPSRLIGSVDRLSSINSSDWLSPEGRSSWQVAEGQAWYRVQVTSFHDGQQWRRSPFSDIRLSAIDAAYQLWGLLGLGSDPQLQIMVWTADGTSQTLQATVKAARYSNGAIQLLAIAEDVAFSSAPVAPLAMTSTTIHWLEPGHTTTLAMLHEEQPAWVNVMLPALWQEFQQMNYAVPVSTAQPETRLETVGEWAVQLIDLTGNNQPEAILLFQPSVGDDAETNFDSTASPEARTIIFSDLGDIIYSDIGAESGQSIVAIADLGDNGTPALIIGNSDDYRLRRWSIQNQRFE
jgi:hypothetical protein